MAIAMPKVFLTSGSSPLLLDEYARSGVDVRSTPRWRFVNVSLTRLQAVAESAHGHQADVARVLAVELRPQPAHVDIDRSDVVTRCTCEPIGSSSSWRVNVRPGSRARISSSALSRGRRWTPRPRTRSWCAAGSSWTSAADGDRPRSPVVSLGQRQPAARAARSAQWRRRRTRAPRRSRQRSMRQALIDQRRIVEEDSAKAVTPTTLSEGDLDIDRIGRRTEYDGNGRRAFTQQPSVGAAVRNQHRGAGGGKPRQRTPSGASTSLSRAVIQQNVEALRWTPR